MGQKVSPIGMRVGVIRDWESRWYANDHEFGSTLMEDVKIREFIEKYYADLANAAVDKRKANPQISRVEIERSKNRLTVIIRTAHPGVVIGQDGKSIEGLKKKLEKLTNAKNIQVNVVEIANPNLDARLVARWIADELEGRKSFRATQKKAIQNTMRAGAYRGYGATQGQFAVESIINELADELNMDPCEIRFKNMTRENEVLSQYYNEELNACALDRCLEKAMEMIDYKNKPLRRDMGDFVRGLGVSLSMQGSGISCLDVGSVEIKLQDDGFYTLSIGATDMGTGCDTILAQMVAECMDCDVDQVVTSSLDTDHAPYDTGSYASSTTYVTGMAVVKACEKLRNSILEAAAGFFNVDKEDIEFDGKKVYSLDHTHEMSLADFADTCFNGGIAKALIASDSHMSPTSPPPFMVGIAEVDVDKLTGEIKVHDYVSVVDCGTVINPNLARVQAEGGIVQGIGMAISEDITYSNEGKMRNRNFLQYKLPTRVDVPSVRVAFESSYEDNGPFGAKSIGEVVINTPTSAIASAIKHATGVQVRTLPITAEKVLLGKEDE